MTSSYGIFGLWNNWIFCHQMGCTNNKNKLLLFFFNKQFQSCNFSQRNKTHGVTYLFLLNTRIFCVQTCLLNAQLHLPVSNLICTGGPELKFSPQRAISPKVSGADQHSKNTLGKDEHLAFKAPVSPQILTFQHSFSFTAAS